MDGSNWEFNAPTTFIDFSNGDHMRDTGIDESYFCYDHEMSPNTDMSMDFKPSGLTDITNKSRLTFDSPAKAAPKTPVIKPVKAKIQDQNGNHTVLKVNAIHQGAGDATEAKIVGSNTEVDMKLSSPKLEEPKQEQMVPVGGTDNHGTNAEDHIPVHETENIAHTHETAAQIHISNADQQTDSVVTAGSHIGSNDNDGTKADVDMQSQDEQSDTVDSADNLQRDAEIAISEVKVQPSLPVMSDDSTDKQTDSTDMPGEVIASGHESNVFVDAVDTEAVTESTEESVPMESMHEQINSTDINMNTKERAESAADTASETRSKPASLEMTEMPSDSLDERIDTDADVHTRRNITPREPSRRWLSSSQVKHGNLRSQILRKQRSQSRRGMATPKDPDAPPIKKLKGTDPLSCRKSARAPLRSQSRQATPSWRLTTPKGADQSLKSHAMERRSAKSATVDFVKGLRQYPTSQKKLTPTITKPFHFSTDRKRKLEFDSKKSETYNFEKAAKAGIKKGPIKIKPALTVPRTPNLRSKTRKRPPSVVSAQEMEEKEIEEMKNYRFKAKPADPKMLEHPASLPKVERPAVTETEEFHLRIDKRLEERTKTERPPSPCREFKAKPVPKRIFKPPMIEPAKVQRKIQEKIQKPKSPGPKQAPEKRTNTKVMPFSFYERDMERLAKKEEKIKMIHEAEKAAANSVRATPILIGPYKPPPIKKRPSTVPEPFELRIEKRVSVRVEKWKKDVELEEEALKEKRNFKANESYKESLHKPGWRPKLMGKHTEKFEEFSLHLKTRASQRRDFDDHLKRKEAHIMALMEEKKREEEQRMEEEVKEIRKKAEFKANPVRKYKEFVIKESDRLPTLPESPNFSDRFYKKLPENPDNAN